LAKWIGPATFDMPGALVTYGAAQAFGSSAMVLPPRGIRAIVVGIGLVACTALALAGEARAHRGPEGAAAVGPNVVLIVADDMRADSLWVMPALGRLADRGVTFTHAFATTPLCCPSRASILTGLYARHHGVLTNDPPSGGVEAFDDRSTLATWLQSAGVRTGLVGRYLNGYNSLAIPPGWDSWYALWQRGNDYYGYRVNDHGVQRYFGAAPEVYSTRVLGGEALRFLEEDRGRPFLLVLTPRAPHSPATPDRLDSGALKGVDLPVPPSYGEEDLSDKPSWVQQLGPLSEEDREELEDFRRRQLETLISVDLAIAAIVEALGADGRLGRTWLIFTSDNGLTLGEHGLGAGKACAYEECVRVPLVVVPPGGLPAPRADDRLVANIDLAPTIAAIMGVGPGAPVDGRNLLPLLGEAPAAWRDALVLEQWGDGSGGRGFLGLRTPDRKYVRHENGEEELYDQATDPYELRNLRADPAWAEEAARLAGRLEALLAEPSPDTASPALPRPQSATRDGP
jgi:N-acetylglucosamine-6-sulfatase